MPSAPDATLIERGRQLRAHLAAQEAGLELGVVEHRAHSYSLTPLPRYLSSRSLYLNRPHLKKNTHSHFLSRTHLAAHEAGLELGVVKNHAQVVDAVLRILHPQPVLRPARPGSRRGLG